ncbi:precorrin-6A/cobalt-precorrin-6A reductase [Chitinophaga sp. CF118]|uniref:precorrin-6A/cobalt-precorrin-6A reductase n=1 Tax=Chitinophaga sp. CF118 TaxID=1884367 RepID=UPI0008EABDB0|nr:precorrin-6A/cobalt-precorrin-6A reductase [Chitinophaga sp. CF118]SFD48357.1 precorrin-6A/cobalt-precorrin-6A reductase [Chitinophaga sp. CF118]
MILVFGGTTEGKKVAGILEKSGYQFCYSTKTEIDFQPGEYRFGAFIKERLEEFCIQHGVEVIVHASHPFAEELHQTIHLAAKVPVLRFERAYPERYHHPLIKYFSSYPAVITYLEEKNVEGLLALTGVQTIEKLKPYWEKHKTVFRILPRESSVVLAEKAGFPKENLILEMPGDDIVHELAIINSNNIQCILTKESGESGFLSVKIAAALQAGIPILIIERPALPETFIPVHNEEELLFQLNQLLK